MIVTVFLQLFIFTGMKFLFLHLLFFPMVVFSQKEASFTVQTFSTVSGLTIRAIDAVDDSTVWFAANRGVWGFTEDAGKTWHIDSLKIDTIYPEFRSIAVLDDSTVLLLSIASPAYMMRTTDKGKTWKMVYKNKHPDIFFDSMKFWDHDNGMAVADPIDGKIQLINTHDAGLTWKPVNEALLPRAEKGEAFFAASNTCFDLDGYHSWLVTGGVKARVFHSSNGGGKHKIYDTPLPEGETMTGIYSVDFWDKKNGAIAGGHYDSTNVGYAILAITSDGGKTWKPFGTQPPDFGSCVQYLTKDELFITSRKSAFHIDLRTEKVTEIKDEAGNSLACPALRISPSGKVIWLGGLNGKINRVGWE